MIVFTIGNFHVYEEIFEDLNNPPLKLGKTENYEGGCIWKTKEDAQNFISGESLKEFSFYSSEKKWQVYGVEINHENDISSEPGELGYYNLLVDSKLFKLD